MANYNSETLPRGCTFYFIFLLPCVAAIKLVTKYLSISLENSYRIK